MTECGIGVDVGGTKIAAGVLHGQELRHLETRPTPHRDPEVILDAIAQQLQRLQPLCPPGTPMGVGLPGPLDLARQVVLFAPNLAHFVRVEVVEGLQARGYRITLENDAKAAALAEARLGAGRGAQSCLYVTVSTGIGSGLVLEGRLWRGWNGQAGELGHWALGEGGTLEGIASGTAIARAASSSLGREVSTVEAFELAQRGEMAAKRVIEQALAALGQALANVQKLLDPQVIVLGGGVSRAGPFFMEQVQQAAEEASRGFARPNVRLAELEQPGVVGAALAGLIMAQ